MIEGKSKKVEGKSQEGLRAADNGIAD